MKNENLIKFTIIFGVGGLIFWGLKIMQEKNAAKKTSNNSSNSSSTNSFDSSKTNPSKENIDIVTSAYGDAIKAGEPASRLTELNKELMKEFGMRCYMDKDKKLVVIDSSGTIITTK